MTFRKGAVMIYVLFGRVRHVMDQSFEAVDEIIARREIAIPVGVIIERRQSKHPWGSDIWKSVEILPGAGPVDEWITISEGEDYARFHAETVALVLHRKETEALKLNITSGDPHIYVVLRENEEDADGKRPYLVHLVTASSYDAQDYLDTSEEVIDRLPMPQSLFEWIRAFVAEHHVEETFKKRKRDKLNIEEEKFGKEPIFAKREGYRR
ncbi:MAG: DUF3305 domain-containing protein [Pseudomonadota bacterium]